MNGIGAHEVIIETPDHTKDLADLSVDEVKRVILAYRDRIIDLKKDVRFRYIMIFKNQGEAAGASLEHSHSQLIATPVVPKRVFEEFEGAKRYYEYKERCIFCDINRQEIQNGVRVIARNENFVSIAPFASRFPFEIWTLPLAHNSFFESINESEARAFAEMLKTTLSRLTKALNSSPVDSPSQHFYHWHVEIIPKLIKVAGFEWGTGFYINPTTPEDAAHFLREIEPDK
jgi:UDPglucose--hexose-1-phosphate uridylyltransferase